MSMPYLIKIELLLSSMMIIACNKQSENTSTELFHILDEEQTGITFTNQLHESDTLNILTYLYYYNGGGVAIGDINNDSLPDLYFSGNEVGNKLYLNHGNMQFTDITKSAGVECSEGWNTGVSMVDINSDGLLDIYVCQVSSPGVRKGRNQLFINNGDLTFTESAHKYGLGFRGLATQAAFLDFDRDGDLDCYLLNHSIKDPEQFKAANITRQTYEPESGDQLLENREGQYTDITEQAGIYRSPIGFGLGIDVGDLNRDGWPDIYIGNDFHENDYLYLNNHDGTFREVISRATGHISNFTMGVTIADINNDAWPDILSLDMKPEDEKTYKMSGGWETFNIYKFKRTFGYHHQSARNALQISQGLNDAIPVYSELACQYGIEATDWSWSPLIMDLNGDGNKDIFITNGIVRRPNDLDFVNYFSSENINKKNTGLKLVNTMPRGGVSNYLFLNEPDSNKFNKISISDPGSKITNGASYSDLDLDGDLDIVCNNLNQASYIIQNNSPVSSYVTIQLRDTTSNWYGLGAQVTIFQKKQIQYQFLHHLAGFESGKEPSIYFATNGQPVDSMLIQWPDGHCQVIHDVAPGYQVIHKNTGTTQVPCNLNEESISKTALSVHVENEPEDLTIAKWMPYTLSSFGPRIAIGKKYYYMTNAAGHGTLHHIADDKDVSDLLSGIPKRQGGLDENDAVFADFNNDGYEDLFITFGGNTLPSGKGNYHNELFFGQKDGSFQISGIPLPKTDRNSSIVRPCDFDKDGDVDLFIGTLSRPGHYGWSEPSMFFINVGNGVFSAQEAPVWEMVFDAQWSDMDQDGLQDLVILGHWMPVTILYNRSTHWEKETIDNSEGLWFTLNITDLNHDSIPDIMAGNFGLNHPYNADSTHPILLYLKDFDLNGQSDPIFTYMVDHKRYIYPNLELFLQQLPDRKKEYILNKNFAGKQVSEIFNSDQLEKSTQRTCNVLSSGVFLSDHKTKKWNFVPFPQEVQRSPVWSICQVNEDSYAFGGNFYDLDPNLGRQDALFLTLLKYDAQHGWIHDDTTYRNFHRRSEIRDLLMIGDRLYIASNNDTLIALSPRIK